MMMRQVRWLLAAVALGGTVLASAPARADVIEVFTAGGVLVNGSVLSGTVQINITTGSIVASNLAFSLAPVGPYTNILTALPEPQFDLYDFNVLDAAGDNFSSGLQGGSLVNYAGGAFCSDSNECNANSDTSSLVVAPGAVDVIHLQSGALRPTGTVVPEPATIALMLTGLTGLALLRRRWG